MTQFEESSDDEDLNPGKDLKSYIESRVELFSISIAEQIASAASASIHKFVGILFLSVGAIFLWIALGFFLGELLDSQALGFLLAGLPLLFLGAILYNRSSKSLEEKIQTEIIQKVSYQTSSATQEKQYVNESSTPKTKKEQL